MTATDTLSIAADLLDRFGHQADDLTGCELSGYSVPGAVAAAAAIVTSRSGAPSARLAAWVARQSAIGYLVTVLGSDPAALSPFGQRATIEAAAWPMGTDWAVAVCEQARALAAASSRIRPALAAAITHEIPEYASAAGGVI